MWQDCSGSPVAFVDALARHKTVSFPTDGQFEEDIRRRPVYGMKLLPYVLRVLDDATPGDKVAAGTPLTVDHVMPQHPGISWDVDKEDDRRLVDTWANLIPLSGPGNSKKGTATWAVARLQIPNESVWKTARVLAYTHETWGVPEIEERAGRSLRSPLRSGRATRSPALGNGYRWPWAISTRRQSAFASCISRGVRQRTWSSSGEATSTVRPLARDVATFRRLRE